VSEKEEDGGTAGDKENEEASGLPISTERGKGRRDRGRKSERRVKVNTYPSSVRTRENSRPAATPITGNLLGISRAAG
jgi:hypothetical protein